MASNKEPGAPPAMVHDYRRVVAESPDVQVKGAKNLYTSINGNMSSCLHAAGMLSLRLPAEKREEFICQFKTSLFDYQGIVQKEYVLVPNSLLSNFDLSKASFAVSLDYVKSLKQKK